MPVNPETQTLIDEAFMSKEEALAADRDVTNAQATLDQANQHLITATQVKAEAHERAANAARAAVTALAAELGYIIPTPSSLRNRAREGKEQIHKATQHK